VLACIGPQTVKTAAELGLRVDVVAAKPDVASLVEALADHAATVRASGELPSAARRKKVAKAAAKAPVKR